MLLTSSIFNLKVMFTKIQTVPPKLQNPISEPGPQAPFPEAAAVTVYCISSRNTLCRCSIQTHAHVHAFGMGDKLAIEALLLKKVGPKNKHKQK